MKTKLFFMLCALLLGGVCFGQTNFAIATGNSTNPFSKPTDNFMFVNPRCMTTQSIGLNQVLSSEKSEKKETSDRSLVFDCSKGYYTEKPLCVKEGTTIHVIYTNVNPFAIYSSAHGLYSEEDDGGKSLEKSGAPVEKPVKQETTPSKALQEVKETASDGKDKSGTKTLNSRIPQAQKDKNQYKLLYDYNQNFIVAEDSFSSFNSIVDQEISRIEKQKQAEQEKEKEYQLWLLCISRNAVLDRIDVVTRDIQNMQAKINNISTIDSSLYNLMVDPTVYEKSSMAKQASAIIGVTYMNDLSVANKIPSFENDIDWALGKIHVSINELKRLSGELSELNQKIIKLDEAYEFQETVDNVKLSVGLLEKSYNESAEKKMRSIATSINARIMKINNATFEIKATHVFTLNTDYLWITDTLYTVNKGIYKIIDPIRIRSYRGRRIDFSAGIGLTFGEDINGRDYFFKTDSANNVLQIAWSKDKRRMNFVPVAFVHYRFVTKKYMHYAFSFGINPDFSDFAYTKVQAGFSLVGLTSNNKLRRLILTGGVAVGMADVLDPRYKEYTECRPNGLYYSQLQGVSESELIDQALRTGYFISLSWTFYSVKSNKTTN